MKKGSNPPPPKGMVRPPPPPSPPPLKVNTCTDNTTCGAKKRIKELERILEWLVALKNYKTTNGKDAEYLQQKEKAWEEARQILDQS